MINVRRKEGEARMIKVVVMATGEALSVASGAIRASCGALWYGFARVCLAV